MSKYTQEQIDAIVAAYDSANGESVEAIARDRSATSEADAEGNFPAPTKSQIASVRAILIRAGVYVKAEKPAPAPKDEGPTKAQLMASLQGHDFDTDGLMGATKDALTRILGLFENTEANA